MGAWKADCCSNDSTWDYLLAENIHEMSQEEADTSLDNVWCNGDSETQKLGVVVWVLRQALTVDPERIEEALKIANGELRLDRLVDWTGDRKDLVLADMYHMRWALDHNGGRGKKTYTPGVMETIEGVKVVLIDGVKTINLPCFGIVVVLTELDPEHSLREVWLGGSISSDLKEVCEHCGDSLCEMECPEFGEYATDRDPDIVHAKHEEKYEFQKHRVAADTMESFILAHAMQGLPIEEPAYLVGIETVHNALCNHL